MEAIHGLETIALAAEAARVEIRRIQIKKDNLTHRIELLTTRAAELATEIGALELTLTKVRMEIQKALDEFTDGLSRL